MKLLTYAFAALVVFTVAGLPGGAMAQAGAPVTRPFAIDFDGVRIAGEVRRAPGASPQTALIIIGGSGVRTRADTEQAAPLFISDDVAVVIYDRRGNGDSTGDFEVPDTLNTAWQIPLFAADVAQIAAYLKRDGFQRVGLLGSSMGGWINVASAARSPDIDFIVSFSGAANSVGVSDSYDALTDQGLSIEAATEAARHYDGAPGYDPAADLHRLRQPGLWVFGAEDSSNPTELDREVLDALIAEGRSFQYLVLPGVDHEFKEVGTDQMNLDWLEPVRDFITGEANGVEARD
jgi:pimeloyl-ACP methyl ester carboxylesterase